jgi:5-methyltetrahydrofolate--homocysteine methyltransferase
MQLMAGRRPLFDGAMGSLLIARGLKAGEAPERWNLERPEVIRDVHRAYFEVGASVVLTNTFGGNGAKLAACGLRDRVREINGTAVEIALEACPPGGLVAGDVGPTGKFRKPMGELTSHDFEEIFEEQIGALAGAGASLILVETMYDLEEILAALRAARRAAPGLPVIGSMTFKKTRRGFFTIMGDDAGDSMRRLQDAGADAVGANCTLGTEDMLELTPVLRAATTLPLLTEPNAGMPALRNGKTVYDQTPEAFASDALRLFAAGASFVGGCCGTTPEHIRQLSLRMGGNSQ